MLPAVRHTLTYRHQEIKQRTFQTELCFVSTAVKRKKKRQQKLADALSRDLPEPLLNAASWRALPFIFRKNPARKATRDSTLEVQTKEESHPKVLPRRESPLPAYQGIKFAVAHRKHPKTPCLQGKRSPPPLFLDATLRATCRLN